jgi:heme/copper-type cytochrome/quinol oxidase subunit 2
MLQKIKLMLLSASTVFAFAAPALVAASVSAQVTTDQIQSNLCQGSNGDLNATGDNSNCGDQATNTANNLVSTVINIISVVVGIVAVIMIIYAGFRYVTSGGRDESVKGAKNTILYAIIGLVIVALAQIIVHFVLAKTSQATT